jgi:hypothetical protein
MNTRIDMVSIWLTGIVYKEAMMAASIGYFLLLDYPLSFSLLLC